MLSRWRSLPEEVRLLARTAIYGVGIAAIYWFVAYEWTGTVLLAGFGVATGVGAVVLGLGSRRASRLAAGAGSLAPDGPFGDESGAIPGPSLAPLAVGFGLTIVALGLVFGIWFVLAGLIPFGAGGYSWLRSVGEEIRA